MNRPIQMMKPNRHTMYTTASRPMPSSFSLWKLETRPMLKKVSTLARQDMEKFMGTKVYLETWVKVKENWRDNVNYVRNFGYHDD